MLQNLKWDNIAVMVIDDNAFMRNLIASTIKTLGIMNVFVESSAVSAVERLKLSKIDPHKAEMGTIDIILSDFVMPSIDGNLFLRWIRTGDGVPDRFVPFVMVSGAADREVVETARDTGVTEFLGKPFSAQSMADHILEVINNPRQFVLAPGYFGPDRRRADRVADWSPSIDDKHAYDDSSRPFEERRVTKASEIQVLKSRSAEKSLRDDVRAIYFRPANRLRDKLGPNALRGRVDFDPLVIQAAENRIKELVGDYAEWVMKYLDSISESQAALEQNLKDYGKHIANINDIAHELRGQGGTFDYPLITAFAKSLYDATRDSSAKVTPNKIKLIEAHVNAIRVVFKDKVKGDGGKVGATLLKEIHTAVKKYS